MVMEQRLPFGSVWHGEHELVHVVRDAFVTVPPLAPGAEVTLQFRPEGPGDEPLVRQPSNKGITVIDARRIPATRETVLVVKVCRSQPLCVEGVDALGAYRVQVDDEPVRYFGPRVVQTIQAKLSNSKTVKAAIGEVTRRTKLAGITTFLDLMIEGDPDHFIERTVRIKQLSGTQAEQARIAMILATPKKTGRVTPFLESVPAKE
jgi:hypothetical protein